MTSVYNSFDIDLAKIIHNPCIDRKFRKASPQKAKRALFGIDHESTQKFLDRELTVHLINQSRKWNFDLRNECTLDPEGEFCWRPVSPPELLRPIKRRIRSDEMECDIDELYCTPVEIIRPVPILPSEPIMGTESVVLSPKKIKAQSPDQETKKAQRLITDFMPIKKNSITFKNSRPAKIPRLNELS